MADVEDKENNQEEPAKPVRRFLTKREAPEEENPEAAAIRAREAARRMEEMMKLKAAREEANKRAEEERAKKEREVKLSKFAGFIDGKNTNAFTEAIRKKMLGEE